MILDRSGLDTSGGYGGEIAGVFPAGRADDGEPFGTEPNGYAALFAAEPDLARRIAHRSRDAGIESDMLRYNYRPLYHTPVLAGYAPSQP